MLAEYWADGPKSETPPGHWNVIANDVSDSAGFERRLGGTGPSLDPLEWDVKAYFTLNGAVHDGAIAAWGLKGFYDSARPISMIRYMGGKGQSSDPAGPSYDPDGLPLESGLVEVVRPVASSAPGERHEQLADHVGELAVRTWRGFPDDPTVETSGVGWIRAVEWVPYQRETFVTPAFAGYVSGHSTFSRAAAEVLAASPVTTTSRAASARSAPESSSIEVGPTDDVDAAVGALLRRRRPGRHLAVCMAASTSRPTTSKDAGSGRRAARTRGRSPSIASTAPTPDIRGLTGQRRPLPAQSSRPCQSGPLQRPMI